MDTDYFVVDIETTGRLPWNDQLLAVGVGDTAYRPDEGREVVNRLMEQEVVVVCHTNFDLRWLCLDGVAFAQNIIFHDTKVMAWMIDDTTELTLDSLCARYLGYTPPKPIKRVKGRIMFDSADSGLIPIEDVPWPELKAYNESDLKSGAEIYEFLRGRLKEIGLWEYFVAEEAPFSHLLIEMEITGLPLDRPRAEKLLKGTTADSERIHTELASETGAIDFNVGSGDMVANFLYNDVWEHPVKFAIPRLVEMPKEEKLAKVIAIAPEGVEVQWAGRSYGHGVQTLKGLNLEPPKVKLKWDEKPKKRPTVSSKLLNVLYGDHPWIAGYVEWRRIEKLNGYLRDWIAREHEGRLYGRFDQSGTLTGRLAGKDPNLQQVSHASGVRELFRGPMVVGDYAGLEARLAAHFSQDPMMLDIFHTGKDLYGVLAGQAWGGEATKENPKRNLMKVIWLASQYGARGETLATTMAIAGMRGYTPKKADAMLFEMMAQVPRLFEWRDEVIASAHVMGYVTTIAGRKRYLADISSAQWNRSAKAERQAINGTVQGSAADIVRRVMLVCREEIPPEIARICLQMHDEIVWERGPRWEDSAFDLIVEICEHGIGFDLTVPLLFDAKMADSWAGINITPTYSDMVSAKEAT